MAAAADLDEIEKVNANCILMANLQQASTSVTQTDKAPIYDSDGSAEVHENCNDNEIFNMFTQEEQYTELLEPIPESHQFKLSLKKGELEPINRQIAQPGNANQNLNGNGNLVAARTEGNAAGQDGNQIRCYNCSGVGHFSRNCTVRPRRRDAAYLQTQLLIAQKEEAGIQLQAEEYDLMAAAADLDEIEKYTELLEPIPESHQVSQNDNNVISEVTSVEQCGEIVEQHPAIFEETRALYDSLYQNLAIEVEKVNLVNRKLKETNADLTTELARFKIQTRVQNFEIQFLKEASKFVGDFKSLANEADESLAKHKAFELEIKRLLKAVVSQDIMNIVQKESIVDTSNLQTELGRTKERFENCIIKKENEYAKLWNDWYKKCDECKYDKISYDKAYKDMQQKIERLQAQLGDLKGKSKDTSCVSDTRNPLFQKLENKNVELEFQLFKKVSDKKDNTHDTSTNTKFAKQSIVENLPKVGETHALSNPVTSNSISTPQEPKVVKNDKVIALGMFRINPFKTSREEKVDNTKTRRPQPSSNTKNDRVPSASKSSRSKNKGVEVEEHHRNLLLSKNNKHMSSACNNIKLDSQNVISKVVCAMCKKCLIYVNHDVCLRNYVNGKNSHGRKQKENVSIKEKQKKHQPHVKKPKKLGFLERLATPKPRKPKFLLRWSPTCRMFDQKGKIVDSSESESQSDCSNGDNACCSKYMTGNLKLLINFVWKFMGTVRFENDHVDAILGFGDLQWGNILITKFYFVEGLGHNLFSVGQFCDSDLEVAFRRNACFVRNFEGVYLLKGDRSINLYTINLHEMASTSQICLMARASSTKSWLWHQRLSHLNFDTINDLAGNDLVSGLPKFKYHKEHIFPSCEQGKSKRASHPPKPVPNSRQRLHLLHMDLYGPMRIASINGKRYVLVIVDDYSRYMWVHFLRSKDKAPEVIKTFLKRITVLLQSPVIIIRTDNDTKFKNQVLKEYFDSVGISHQMSSVRTPQQNRVVERRNRMLVEAARIMLIFSRATLFLWAEAIATTVKVLCGEEWWRSWGRYGKWWKWKRVGEIG
nr:putative ribonuclease H-like domain-containing protein [Tanacetum cinerariifolium]